MSLPFQIDDQSPRPRVVQNQKRRHSIRLEPVFWQALENLARDQGKRLGKLIDELAESYGGRNFASHLRVFALISLQRALARQALGGSADDLYRLVEHAPAPGLILSRNRSIIGFNQAFLQWLGSPDAALIGAALNDLLQVRTAGSFNVNWDDLVTGRRERLDAKVLHIQPGQARAAQARILGLRSRETGSFHAVLWLTARPKQDARLANSRMVAARNPEENQPSGKITRS
jgi:predicted DNA-binding ribbon-helix-helix protein